MQSIFSHLLQYVHIWCALFSQAAFQRYKSTSIFDFFLLLYLNKSSKNTNTNLTENYWCYKYDSYKLNHLNNIESSKERTDNTGLMFLQQVIVVKRTSTRCCRGPITLNGFISQQWPIREHYPTYCTATYLRNT